ncbi:MAG: hypothetical protein M0Z54_00330 [Thermaerobacter sp.]|nr:hypothetical protein [Thermaerobacter sp.]
MKPNWRTSLATLWQDDRSTMWRLMVVGALGIALVAWGSWGGGAAKGTEPPSTAAVAGGSGLGAQEARLDRVVAGVVAAIPGSGAVHVAVSLAAGSETEFASHRTSQRVLAPQVQGVVVVASGASSPAVRQEITTAVETLLQVSAYQVLVLPDL